MADIILPPDLYPQEEESELVDSGTVAFSPEFAQGVTQRAQYFEPYIRVTQRWKSLRLEDKARMMQTLSMLSGRYNTLRARVGFSQRGVMPASELLTNNSFVNSINGWTVAGQLALSASDRVMRMTYNGNSGTNYYASQVITLTQSAAYYAQAAIQAGYGTSSSSCGVMVGSGSGLGNYGDSRAIGSGLRGVGFIAPVTSATFNAAFTGNSQSAGDFVSVPYTSAARCALVNSGTQTGTMLRLKCLPTSTENLYCIGDLISVNGELKRLTAPINSDGSGNGIAQFQPSLFRAATTNDAVMGYLPMGKFMLDGDVRWSNRFGLYADLELTFGHIYE